MTSPTRKKRAFHTAAPHVGPDPNTARRFTVCAMYDAGLSLRQIAAALGITYQAVHQILVRSGVPRRPRGGNQGSHSRRK